MSKLLEAVVTRLFSIRLFGGLLAGLIIAVLLNLAAGIFAGFIRPAVDFPFFEVADTRLTSITFVIVFCALSAIFYAITYKEREDILTPLRKHLRGLWRIEYQHFYYDQQGALFQKKRNDICTIGIDPDTAKLYILIDMAEGPYFRAAKTRVDEIMLNPGLVPKRMALFYELALAIEPELATRHNMQQATIRAPMCAVLEIEEPANRPPRITAMHGTWYDLNGVLAMFFQDFAKREGISMQAPLPTRGNIVLRRIHDEH